MKEINQISEKLILSLIEKKITITTAESCTGGGIAEAITKIAGCSEIFEVSLVTYSNYMKHKLLGVKLETLETYGAVSEQTAVEMVNGVAKLSNADLAIAVTGLAGPGGGSIDKPVGTVWVAWKFKNLLKSSCYNFSGTRDEIRLNSIKNALSVAQDMIES